jgi:hypothetical protein
MDHFPYVIFVFIYYYKMELGEILNIVIYC